MNILNKLRVKKNDLFYLLFPITLSYLVVAVCPMPKKSGKKVKFRPPPYIFGIIWPILYILLGYAWVNSQEHSLWYFKLSILLPLFLVFYSCYKNKFIALGIILASILVTLICYTVSNQFSKLLLCPLLVWLGFAVLLLSFDINETR